MNKTDFIANELRKLLTESIKANFSTTARQQDIVKEIGISQSIVSRLLNKTYVINGPANKVFEKIAAFLGKDAGELWTKLESSYNKDFETHKQTTSKLYLGIPSNATFTAPLIHAIDENRFPDWLELAHTHKDNKPNFCNKKDYKEQLFRAEMDKGPDPDNPFADCYMSGDLPQLLFHTDPSQNQGERFFDAIICPDDAIAERSTKNGPVAMLSDDKNEIIKIATIANGYTGLVCVFEKKPKDGTKLDDDLHVKNYHIDYMPPKFDMNELAYDNPFEDHVIKKRAKHFNEFLNVLRETGKDSPFCICGFEGSAAFKTFKDFLGKKFTAKTGNEADDKLIEKLYTHPYITIDLNSNGKVFDEIATAVKKGEKLILVGFSPYMHNVWQRVAKKLKLGSNEYVHLHRFNFSQWTGKNSFSLYLAKASFGIETMKKIHDLLKLVFVKWKSIGTNRNMEAFLFFIYEGKNRTESKNLFDRACQELGFAENPFYKIEPPYLVNYAPELINYFLESA